MLYYRDDMNIMREQQRLQQEEIEMLRALLEKKKT